MEHHNLGGWGTAALKASNVTRVGWPCWRGATGWGQPRGAGLHKGGREPVSTAIPGFENVPSDAMCPAHLSQGGALEVWGQGHQMTSAAPAGKGLLGWGDGQVWRVCRLCSSWAGLTAKTSLPLGWPALGTVTLLNSKGATHVTNREWTCQPPTNLFLVSSSAPIIKFWLCLDK